MLQLFSDIAVKLWPVLLSYYSNAYKIRLMKGIKMRKVTPLTEQQIEAASPRVKEYNLGDGDGLSLKVKPTGSKLWRFSYYHPITRKRNNLALGKYPDLSLVKARAKAIEARDLLTNGIDPKQYRDAKRKEEAEVNQYVFENVVNEWLKIKSSELKPTGLKTITNSLDNFILPYVSNCSIKDINISVVMDVLKEIKDNGDSIVFMRNYLYFHQIMEYAKTIGLIDHNPLNKLTIEYHL